MAQQFRVRRLAAVDMHGSAGTALRRRIVLAEFFGGTLIAVAVGLLLLVQGSGSTRVFGLYLLGVAANYAALASYALRFRTAQALAVELEGVDVASEFRFYSLGQFRLLIPLLVAVLALQQRGQPDDGDDEPS